jgi:hypothetical protein
MQWQSPLIVLFLFMLRLALPLYALLGIGGLYCGWIPGQIYAFNKGDSALAISAVSNSAGVT